MRNAAQRNEVAARERNGFRHGFEAIGDPVDLTHRKIMAVKQARALRQRQNDLTRRIFDAQSDPARRCVAAHRDFDRATANDHVETRRLVGLMGK